MEQKFVELLRHFDHTINTTLRELGSDFSVNTLFLLAGISFLYGILHSLGPGHGKALAASYFLKDEHPLRKSMVLSLIISLIHTFSAIILSLLLFYVLTGIRGMFRIQLQSYFMIASGIMITIIGILFLFFKIFLKKHKLRQDKLQNRNLVLVGVSAGIIPCPVSSMIMLLTLGQGLFFVGLTSVMSISAGMFVVLSAVGIVSIYSRATLLKASARFFNKTETVSNVIEYVSIIFIVLLGLSMSSTILLLR